MNNIKLSLPFALLLAAGAANSAPVVELFTSQGCYSCPPADEFLAEIITRQPDVVALEFHVDYWDTLRYGAAGVWKDPFSDPSYSQRQRRYNANDLEGREGVYTPQMIINGQTAQVGTSKGRINRAIASDPPEIEIKAEFGDEGLVVKIDSADTSESILWLAVFDRERTTDVKNGENHGKTIVNHHVVRELVPLGRWEGDDVNQSFDMASYGLTADGTDSGCAVFLQDESLGAIQGATYCR